jgi:hypothetical protein
LSLNQSGRLPQAGSASMRPNNAIRTSERPVGRTVDAGKRETMGAICPYPNGGGATRRDD